MAVGTISGGNMPIVFPPSGENTGNTSSGSSGGSSTSGGYTYVTDDLYYSGGYLGTLKISAIGLSVKIYQGTGSSTLAKGAGHFTDTSIWDGTVALAGHNRGVNNHFGKIHTLEIGDKITLTTKLGTRTYKVTSVSKVSETDRSAMTPTGEDRIVLYTCVMNQSAYRWCVRRLLCKLICCAAICSLPTRKILLDFYLLLGYCVLAKIHIMQRRNEYEGKKESGPGSGRYRNRRVSGIPHSTRR